MASDTQAEPSGSQAVPSDRQAVASDTQAESSGSQRVPSDINSYKIDIRKHPISIFVCTVMSFYGPPIMYASSGIFCNPLK